MSKDPVDLIPWVGMAFAGLGAVSTALAKVYVTKIQVDLQREQLTFAREQFAFARAYGVLPQGVAPPQVQAPQPPPHWNSETLERFGN